MFGKRITPFLLAGLLAAAPALSGCIGANSAAMEEYKELGISQMEEGDYDEAAVSFQAALDESVGLLGAEEIDISYYKAMALYLSGDPDSAIEVYTALIDFDEKNWEPYYLRGSIYLQTDRAEEALDDFAGAAARHGNSPELCLRICENLINAGLEDEAQTYIGTALDIQPSDGEDYYALGRICCLTGDTDNAIAYLQQAREMGQDDAVILLADLYSEAGDSENAAAMFEEYAEQYPDDPQVLSRLGAGALADGEYGEAVSYLEQARETADEDDLPAIVTNLVAAYEYSGDFESAWEVAGAYLADHSDEALEREYTFLSTRVGALPEE